ncbi:hypothetical protein BS47DRAFT_1402384 [Hydnum rufescens UP504]|uniref:Uncharacterized protein n=1 Tax=Hydnum rufescens UP504 TaxID=1448309 RepID=A0A9P6ACZ3_9AGAM|nr:hypothetical protein BS47DRAFT_1402384 [Hydnum rufescens UP504]
MVKHPLSLPSIFNPFITPKDGDAPPIATFNPFVTPKDGVSAPLAHMHPGDDDAICADPFGLGSLHIRTSSGAASFDLSLFSPATVNNYNSVNAYHAHQHSLSSSSSSVPAPPTFSIIHLWRSGIHIPQRTICRHLRQIDLDPLGQLLLHRRGPKGSLDPSQTHEWGLH